MNILLPARPDLLRSQRRSTAARALAFMVALLFVLCAPLSAEAKKKKAKSKKGKTPSSSSKKSTGKQAAPADESESDEADSDEKASSKKAPADEERRRKPRNRRLRPSKAKARGRRPRRRRSRARRRRKGRAPRVAWPRCGSAWAARRCSGPSPGTRIWARSRRTRCHPDPRSGRGWRRIPAAFATDGFASNIGLYGSFNYGIGAQSKLPSGMMLTTKYQDFLAGVKVRIPVGTIIPYVAAAYGMQKFHLEPADPAGTRPNFNYAFIRAGAGARAQFTPSIDMDLGAGYLYCHRPGLASGRGPGALSEREGERRRCEPVAGLSRDQHDWRPRRR